MMATLSLEKVKSFGISLYIQVS